MLVAVADVCCISDYHVVYDASSNTENGISNDISIFLYGSESEEQAIKAASIFAAFADKDG